ncbi:MAG: hypothetical protein ACFE94_07665 [Candidatus Hodarchaeota archaeon]
MLELKELAENGESARLEKAQELRKDKNKRLRELNLSMQYNSRYYEEGERYKIKADALKAYYNLLNAK